MLEEESAAAYPKVAQSQHEGGERLCAWLLIHQVTKISGKRREITITWAVDVEVALLSRDAGTTYILCTTLNYSSRRFRRSLTRIRPPAAD